MRSKSSTLIRHTNIHCLGSDLRLAPDLRGLPPRLIRPAFAFPPTLIIKLIWGIGFSPPFARTLPFIIFAEAFAFRRAFGTLVLIKGALIFPMRGVPTNRAPLAHALTLSFAPALLITLAFSHRI